MDRRSFFGVLAGLAVWPKAATEAAVKPVESVDLLAAAFNKHYAPEVYEMSFTVSRDALLSAEEEMIRQASERLTAMCDHALRTNLWEEK